MVITASKGSSRKLRKDGGLELARFREQRGITLEQVAGETKISPRFLEAIEAEEFEKLPGGIFRTSYLRQYAAAIGFEGDRLLAEWETRRRAGESATVEKPEGKKGIGWLLAERF